MYQQYAQGSLNFKIYRERFSVECWTLYDNVEVWTPRTFNYGCSMFELIFTYFNDEPLFCFVCMFKHFGPTREFFTHWRRHHCRWKAAKFDLCSALMAIEQWGFFRVPHLLWHGVSEDTWHSHLLPSIRPWSCHYLFLRLRSVAAGIRASNLPHARRTLLPTAPPPWSFVLCLLGYQTLRLKVFMYVTYNIRLLRFWQNFLSLWLIFYVAYAIRKSESCM